MRKAIMALAVLGMFVAVSGIAMAGTNIWTQVSNTGGYTSYQEETWVGGYDWSEGSKQMTGYVMEGFENDGHIRMTKEIHTDGEWILEEKLEMNGDGETEIYKHVDVWTEDSTLWEDGHPDYRNPTGAPGELAYPSEVWVEYVFTTPKPFSDADTFHVLLTEPPAEDASNTGPHAYYDKFIQTDEQFMFGEKVGIGDFPSDFEPRPMPEFPKMCWFQFTDN